MGSKQVKYILSHRNRQDKVSFLVEGENEDIKTFLRDDTHDFYDLSVKESGKGKKRALKDVPKSTVLAFLA